MSIKINSSVTWVGKVDWELRSFHGEELSTYRGTTYNSYLVKDKKVALIDTVWKPFAKEFVSDLKKEIDLSKIDYIIANHVESDHSGSISEILKLAPQAQLLGTARCREGLQKHYFGNWEFQVVKTGDEINLGEKRLKFLEAPMLHWPETMFTYLMQDKILRNVINEIFLTRSGFSIKDT